MATRLWFRGAVVYYQEGGFVSILLHPSLHPLGGINEVSVSRCRGGIDFHLPRFLTGRFGLSHHGEIKMDLKFRAIDAFDAPQRCTTLITSRQLGRLQNLTDQDVVPHALLILAGVPHHADTHLFSTKGASCKKG